MVHPGWHRLAVRLCTQRLGFRSRSARYRMKNFLSVNEALDQLADLDGQPVAVQGILCFEFEHIALWHYPKADQRDANPFGPSSSSIWLSTGCGSIQFNEAGLEKLDGHRVAVLGILHAPDPRLGGCGHMFGSPAEILVSAIDRLPGSSRSAP